MLLTQLKPELEKRYAVRSIGLLGSVVRNDFSASSDVDLAAFIESKLQKKVDLVSKNGIREKYFRHIESEIVYV